MTEEELIRRVMERLPTMPVREREEPVAWRNKNGKGRWQFRSLPILIDGEPLYTAPPQREWHGLTDEERLRCFDDVDWNKVDWCPDHEQYAKAIEAKLKEKNT